MDQIHKKVLSNKTVVIMQRISNPHVLSGYLSNVFTPSDREEIEAKFKQSGATVATQHLIHLLEKRGPTAFPEFIKVLNDNAIRLEDLALELEKEERKLRRQRKPRTEEESSTSPPPPYSALIRSNSEMYEFSLEQQSPVHKQPQSFASSSEPYQEQSSPPPVGNCTVDTLIKDIPFGVLTKVENMMNPDDLSNHNWKGLAGAMGMSADNVRQLEGEPKGRMAGLFDRMRHTKRTIKDLLEFLKYPEVQRLDVIEEIVRGCKLPEELLVPTESSANGPVSSVEECCKSMANFKSMPYPRQESEDDRDTNGKLKPGAGIPRQEEHAQGSKESAQAELDAKSDARLPSQEEGNDENDEVSKPSHHLPCQERSIDSEDVFYSAENHEVTKCSLLLSCCGNSSVERQHEAKLRELEDLLADDEEFEGVCEVTHKYRCKTAELLLSEVQSFLRKLQNPQKLNVISFVYLVGPTMNINGENYLVPAEVKRVSSRADLRHNCLNINWLVAQLSKNCMQVVIVIDGVQVKSPAVDDLNGVLQGLTAMYPPANAVIAFACNPGTVRKDEERLYYIQTMVKYMTEEKLVLKDLFAKVREDLSQRQPPVSSLPLEFSLTSSLLPLCLNQGLIMPSDSCLTSTAILISNPANDGLKIFKEECRKNRVTLKKALLKDGWNCEEISNSSANGTMDELRKTLGGINNYKGTVMIYFIGCTRVVMDCNYFSVALDDPFRPGVPLQWCLDLMCEKLQGVSFDGLPL
ncbi:PREDICTED: uncharacterized protein LOC107351491 isoform X1 [Acropora digitifera]|uniref:uncharacterized protein LOC107351491 isoform X1 n=1 Tax=Acropora digitifera TaxID=70779 RepID=UPI00077A2B66|nr:PREDICTED: uncharacterized protein LOC107351491 isoform X1 [Acropora digitifera]